LRSIREVSCLCAAAADNNRLTHQSFEFNLYGHAATLVLQPRANSQQQTKKTGKAAAIAAASAPLPTSRFQVLAEL